MNHFHTRLMAVATLAFTMLLTGCEQTGVSDENEEPVLRVHDVSDLNVDQLDEKLNELLSREDLPLRGKVELLDDDQLAVNASRYLQDEIAAMMEQLRNRAPADAIQRPFRIEFWLLRMARDTEEGAGDVPEYVAEDLEPLMARYEGYELSVYDYLESFHSGIATVDDISSGKQTRVNFARIDSSTDEILIDANVYAHGEPGAGLIDYHINHSLTPGKALVLGRAHDGGRAEHASYQVLVARAEWTGLAD